MKDQVNHQMNRGQQSSTETLSRFFKHLSMLQLTLFVLQIGCNDIPADNPYDPVTPVVQQAKSTITGSLKAPDDFNGNESITGLELKLLPQKIELKEVTSRPTNDQGEFIFEQVPAGLYELRGDFSIFKPITRVVAIEQGVDLNLTEYQLESLDESDSSLNAQWIEGYVKLEGSELDVHAGITVETKDKPYSTTTKSNGEFRLYLPADTYDLTFIRDGYTSQSGLPVTVLKGEPITIEDQILRRNQMSTVNGQLQTDDPDYNFDGSIVALESLSIPGPDIDRTVTLAQDGRFNFDMLPSGSYSVTATISGHVEFSKPIRVEDGVNELEAFILTREYAAPEQAPTLRGKAFLSDELNADNDGADHSGIKVTAFLENGDQLLTKVETVETGDFAFMASRESFRLEFSKEGYTYERSIIVVWSTDQARFEYNDLPFEENEEIILNQDINGEIIGHVSSNRLPNFDWSQRTFISLEGPGLFRRISPLDDGTFRFDDLPSGQFVLRVDAEGHDDHNQTVILDQSTKDLGEIILSLATATMEGVVYLEDQDIDEGDHSGVSIEAFINGALVATAQSNAQGHYAFTTAQIDHELKFTKDGYEEPSERLGVQWDEMIVDGGQFKVINTNILLKDYTSMVLEGDYNYDVIGRLSTSLNNWDWGSTTSIRLIGDSTVRIGLVNSGDNQSNTMNPFFTIVGLKQGIYGLEINVEGHIGISRVIEVVSRVNDIGLIELTPGVGERIQGKVTLADSSDSYTNRGISVIAKVNEDPVSSTITDDEGNFTIQSSQSTHELEFSKEGYADEQVTVDWSNDLQTFIIADGNENPLSTYENLTLQINPATIKGKIYTRTKRGDALVTNVAVPVAVYEGEIFIDNATTAMPNEQGEGGGDFAINNIRQGVYTIRYGGGDLNQRQEVVQTTAGQTTDIGERVVDLRRGTVTGRVLTNSGRADVITVRLSGSNLSDLNGLVWTTTTTDGEYRLDGLPPGPYSLFATAAGYTNLNMADPITVVADQQTNIADIELVQRRYDVTADEVVTAQAILEFTKDPDVNMAKVWIQGEGVPSEYSPLTGRNQNLASIILRSDGHYRILGELSTDSITDNDPDNDYLNDISPRLSVEVTRDSVAPQLSRVRTADGSMYTAQSHISLLIDCIDELAPSNRLSLRIEGSDGSSFNGGYEPYLDYFLADQIPDGERTLNITCIDWANNESRSQDVRVILDRTPPVISSLVLNGGGVNEPAASTTLSVQINSLDVHSGVEAIAISEIDQACSEMTYRYPQDGPGVIIISAGEGNRQLFACARDLAGNYSSAAVTSNILNIDTIPPEIGSIELGSSLWSNTPVVNIVVNNRELDHKLHLVGDIFEEGVHQANAMPTQVTLTNPDGLKVVSAWFEDAAGNTSGIFSTSITLDRVAPGQGQVILANDQERVNTQTVSVQVSNTIAYTMSVWEVAANTEQCLSKSCNDITFVPFVTTSTFTLSPALENKQVCWQFCDEAGNSSVVGGKQIVLDTHIPRPVPILTSLNPRNHLSFSQDNQPNGYSVTISGRGIAFDTKVKFGAFTLDCNPYVPAISCRADLAGGCGENGLCASSCATECTFLLSPQLVANAGTYPVRLETPQPVEDGLGISESLLFFDVVSPVPKVTDVSIKGVTQSVVNGSPIGQTLEVDIFGQNFTDNVQFKLGPNFAQVLELDEPDQHNNRLARVLLTTEGIMPSDLVDQTLNAINPSPGGGFSNDLPFGVNPTVAVCPDDNKCLSNLRRTRTLSPDSKSLGQRYAFSAPFRSGLVSSHGTSAAWKDEQGQLLFRATSEQAPTVVPYMLEQNHSIQVDDHTFTGPRIAIKESHLRNNGSFVVQPEIDLSDSNYSFALGDWNRDGILDLAIPQFLSQSILIFMGKSDGTFDTGDPQLIQLTCEPQSLETMDLSGDGNLDLVVGCAQSGIKIFLGHSNGQFDTSPDQELLGNHIYDMKIRDMTDDQVPDIMYVDSQGLFLYQGSPNGFSNDQITRVKIGEIYYCALGDLNHDGLPDIMTAGKVNSTTDYGQVFLNVGNGIFNELPSFNLPLGLKNQVNYMPRYALVDLADLNLDGHLDAIFTQQSNDLLSIYLGDGQGAFTAHDQINIDSPFANNRIVGVESLTTGDMNGDGLIDIILGGGGFGSGYQFSNKIISMNRNGKAHSIQTIPLTSRPSRVRVADLNQDGISDIINSSYQSRISTLFGQGTVSTGQTEILSVVDQSFTDISDIDYATISIDGQDTLTILVNRDEGHYTVYTYDPDSDRLVERQILTDSGDLLHSKFVDWNGDGQLDILTVSLVGSLSIFSGLGNGLFQSYENSPPGIGSLGQGTSFTRYSVVEYYDFNGDGRQDINLTIKQNNLYYVKRFFQNDSGLLGASSQLLTNSTYYKLVDVNGDQRPDVVSIDEDNYKLRASFTRIDGTLGPWTSLSNEPIARFLIRDLDGDGLVDFIIQRRNTREIAFLRQRANFSFVLDEIYDFSNLINLGSAVGDINGDGALDLVGYESDQENYIRYGLTNGGFVSQKVKILSPSGGTKDESDDGWAPGVQTAQIYDVNQDGVDDILLPSKGDGSLHVIKPPTPSWWAQELKEMPSDRLTLVSGSNEIHVHQAKQFISKLSVRTRIEGIGLDQAMLKLRAPDGREIILDDGSSHANDSVWVGSYPSDGTVCPLATLHGWQPKGNWTLIAEVGSGAVATLTDFAVITHGTLTQPSKDVCQNPIPMTIGETVWGETKPGKDLYAGTCPSAINKSPEQVYTFVATENSSICLNTFGSDFDTVLYVRSATCDDSASEESCNDDDGAQWPQSQVDMAVVAGERYFVFIDGYFSSSHGSFILNSANVSCAIESPSTPNNICE